MCRYISNYIPTNINLVTTIICVFLFYHNPIEMYLKDRQHHGGCLVSFSSHSVYEPFKKDLSGVRCNVQDSNSSAIVYSIFTQLERHMFKCIVCGFTKPQKKCINKIILSFYTVITINNSFFFISRTFSYSIGVILFILGS